MEKAINVASVTHEGCELIRISLISRFYTKSFPLISNLRRPCHTRGEIGAHSKEQMRVGDTIVNKQTLENNQ